MNSETEKNSFRVIKTMHDHLSKRGFDVSQGKLMDTIFEFIANNEDEMLRMLEEKKNSEMEELGIKHIYSFDKGFDKIDWIVRLE